MCVTGDEELLSDTFCQQSVPNTLSSNGFTQDGFPHFAQLPIHMPRQQAGQHRKLPSPPSSSPTWATGCVVLLSTTAASRRTAAASIPLPATGVTAVTWGLPAVSVPVLSNTTTSTCVVRKWEVGGWPAIGSECTVL